MHNCKLVECGIDVGATELVVAVRRDGKDEAVCKFGNDRKGHKALVAYLSAAQVRVCLEATGSYSLDAALALHAAGYVVYVINPKRARRFAECLGERSKTDPVDARTLRVCVCTMELQPWQPPTRSLMALRSLVHAISAMVDEHTGTVNRLHAAEASCAAPALLRRELKAHAAQLERRIERLRREALQMVASDEHARASFERLCTLPGLGKRSALAVLCEVMCMAPGLSARQWVAMAGLDPRQHCSGTSVHKPARISRQGNRHLRRALFLPALAAIRSYFEVRCWYGQLLQRGKRKMVAVVAVMRKLLHGVFAVLRYQQPYDPQRLWAQMAS